ncbi:histone deacetylase family protein [Nostoc sp. CENA67]|uniref:Histone deacetylase family protein n=1 Tax=Amazonocrinis nigriterrae CENA67 TaxID=2794033 RepID=A0A8J7LDH9_9NOST|nr:histone deacetylase family protein [Amazonocrinis nigriterrae]MBH8565821.1 histone deacetylase family protein [Amazonocrinis nigriterrae CENA67]
MKAILSPYFDVEGPTKFLRRGRFVEHPDVAQRGNQIRLGLEEVGCEILFASSQLELRESILAVHDRGYVDYLEGAWSNWSKMPDASDEIFPNIFPNRHVAQFNHSPVALAGWYLADCAAPIGEYTWRNALLSVSTVLEAVFRIREGESAIYALCRPSGHHASQDMAMGMCFLNNAAIAAQEFRKQFTKVAILDIDMHHGNGTQQIFYHRSDVLTISIHGNPTNFYPFYTGFEHERGLGEGEAHNLNIPLPAGTGEASYLQALEKATEVISSFKADVLIVATGFDTFKSDPLGCFALESTSYNQIASKIKLLDLPTLFVQEGGYFVPALSENVKQLITGFENT